MTARRIATDAQASSCYFRTTTDGHQRKALVQIDERCNLHCAHCFVSATRRGQTMPYEQITDLLIPRLAECRVERVTLTGGEPTIHPRFLDVIRAFRHAGMQVGVCTNATTLDGQQISALAQIGGVHCNVSLDGFRPESHGRFRGDRESFATTVATVRALAAAGLLQGLLCTPHSLAEDDEYRELCEFAAQNGADYVLLNPLSSMGRGVKARGRLAATEERMRHIYELTVPPDGSTLDIVHIRFPSTGSRPLAGCQAGTIIYVFTPGEVTVCPYLVFAARTPQSQHDPGEFIVGNIFAHPDMAERLDAYHFARRYTMGANSTCGSCGMASSCGKGCPAAVISAGERIGAVDAEVCPGHIRGTPAAAADARVSTCGTFVSLDGPGGAGKSTTAALVSQRLAAAGLRVRATAEPSRTPLGEMIRASTDIYRGMALACLVAGDRHHHLATDIRPQRQAGAIVICDRYLPSSLVLQRMDGVDWDTIWQLNTGAEPPDLAVILNAAPAVLAARLTRRGGTHSRFERLPDGPAAESALYHDTTARLTALGWPVCSIDSTARAPGDVAAIVTQRILTLHADRSAHGHQRPVIPDIQHR